MIGVFLRVQRLLALGFVLLSGCLGVNVQNGASKLQLIREDSGELAVALASTELSVGKTLLIQPIGGIPPYQFQIQSGSEGILESVGPAQATYRAPGFVLGAQTLIVSDSLGETRDVVLNVTYTPGFQTPNDTRFDQKYGLNNTGQANGVQDADIDAPEAWAVNSNCRQAGLKIAVIDSGVDTGHPDLAPNLWVNPDEIPGNNIDDDGNGYVDDIHGWNFIGGKDGNVNHDNLEAARLLGKYRTMFNGRSSDAGLSKKEKMQYAEYQELEALITKEQKSGRERAEQYGAIISGLDKLEKMMMKDSLSFEDLATTTITDPDVQRAAGIAGNVIAGGGTLDDLKTDLDGAIKFFEGKYKYHYNPDYNPRVVIGDNYDNITEKYYGNNDYDGPDASHGTHVAGIIAAVRDNEVGMKGVADNVRIMTIRAVPDGDERDKDVANAIRYAVDNGASIINMSFGKGYSWDKSVVDAAVKYAQKNDVLLVHAAGNSAQNNDNTNNFPNDKYEKSGLFKSKKSKIWLEVGALDWKDGEDAPARFSNYGKMNVDLFSPGVAINSTIPDNKYADFQGTSMASPVVAGVAAVLRSYFPTLKAKQVKDILMESTVTLNQNVKTPGAEEGDPLVPFSQLSVTGGVVNVYKAVQKAQVTKGKKKNWQESKQAKAAAGAKNKRNKTAFP